MQCLAQGEVGCKREKKPVGHFNHPPPPFSALFNGLFPIFSILFFLIVMPLKSLCVKILKVASVDLLKYSRLDNLISCSILLFQPLNLNGISFKTFFIANLLSLDDSNTKQLFMVLEPPITTNTNQEMECVNS